MTSIVNFAHMLIYGIPFDVRLSAAERVPPIAAFVAPMLSGLALGSIDAWRARKKLPPAVDPVEANALRGGRMSLADSAPRRRADGGVQRLRRVGRPGGRLRADRRRRRVCAWDWTCACGGRICACWSAAGPGGAIAAAFGAPLTGAFYAFELIIGAYSLANAGPVFAATLVGGADHQGDHRRALRHRTRPRRLP